MKKILVLHSLIFLTIFSGYSQTTYYISATGSDANSGTVASPWRNLSYACSQVHTAGDIIHVDTGTYSETNQCILDAGVSIEGVDTNSTHIDFNYYDSSKVTAAIVASSSSENTNGNQHISGIDFNVIDSASDSVSIFILIRERGNVNIYNCKFSNALDGAIFFYGKSTGGEPATYSQNNSIYNCSFYNNHDRTDLNGRSAGGAIGICGQQTMRIYNNYCNQTGRPSGHNGNFIGAVQGWNKDVKIYNNTSYGPNDDESGQWNIMIESWYNEGGWEVYDNYFSGAGTLIDQSFDVHKGSYDYSIWVHNNIFTCPTQPSFWGGTGSFSLSAGITFENEGDTSGGEAIIDSNTFSNIASALFITMSHGTSEKFSNVLFHHNLCINNAYSGSEFHSFIVEIDASSGLSSLPLVSNVYIDNNTIVSAASGGRTRAALFLDATSPYLIRNIYFRNNICLNGNSYGYITFGGTGTIDSIFSENNDVYNWAHSDDTYTWPSGGTPTVTNVFETDKITSDPLLNADYTLQASSPAIDAGTDVGFPYSGAAPDMGAFEYKGHYVATTGSDSNTGTYASPWYSLSHACSQVHTPGDTIYVEAGNYTESNQCVLDTGVNIEGVDTSSTHITLTRYDSSYYDGDIDLTSTVMGTNGNQSISNLWLDGGSFDAYNGIQVRARSNVTIHDVKFTNFRASAVDFIGRYGAGTLVHATGNQLYNCSTTDCSDRQSNGQGVIILTGQDSWSIHDNIFNQLGRAEGHNGDVIGAVSGYNKNGKYFNNITNKPLTDGTGSSNYVIESWYNEGGTQAYDNTFNGGGAAIVLGSGIIKGDSSYSWYIHDNLFQQSSQLSTTPSGDAQSVGVIVGDSASDVVISDNHFKNFGQGIALSLSHGSNDEQRRININHNLFETMGYADTTFGAFMVSLECTAGTGFDSIYIDNNTMDGSQSRAGLFMDVSSSSGSANHIFFRNNIVQKVSKYGYVTFSGSRTMSNIYLENNIAYNCNGGTTPYLRSGASPTYAANTGNFTSNPLLNTDYTLGSGSPAIDAGINIGYPYNGSAPDIGAFETSAGGSGYNINSTVISNDAKGLSVSVRENPSHFNFNIVTKSGSEIPLNIRVVDMLGRMVEERGGIPANGTVEIGKMLLPGIYFCEIWQGQQRKVIKLVKQ